MVYYAMILGALSGCVVMVIFDVLVLKDDVENLRQKCSLVEDMAKRLEEARKREDEDSLNGRVEVLESNQHDVSLEVARIGGRMSGRMGGNEEVA